MKQALKFSQGKGSTLVKEFDFKKNKFTELLELCQLLSKLSKLKLQKQYLTNAFPIANYKFMWVDSNKWNKDCLIAIFAHLFVSIPKLKVNTLKS